ncbi:MAG: hypothetical protein U0838_01545 [Chloroflexota bacterium]
MLILGDREVGARSAAVRKRGAGKNDPQPVLPWAELAQQLGEEVREKRLG